MNDDRVDDLGRGRPRVQKFFNKPSLTRQEFRDECDLGKVVKRFAKTPEGRLAIQQAQGAAGGEYGDFANVPDFRTSRDIVLRAEKAFMRLPAKLRARFQHDTAGFLDFMQDPKNLEEIRALGLAKPVVEEPKAVAS